LKERKAKARRRATAQVITTHLSGDDEGIITVPDTPPGALREPQSGTTMTVDILAIRLSPEPPRAATRPWIVPPPRQSHLALFPREDASPASTAPPRLEGAEGRQKRKRRHTDRYEEGVEDSELPESQHSAIGRRG